MVEVSEVPTWRWAVLFVGLAIIGVSALWILATFSFWAFRALSLGVFLVLIAVFARQKLEEIPR